VHFPGFRSRLLALAGVAASSLLLAPGAQADSGGTPAPGTAPAAPPGTAPAGAVPTVPGRKAKLVNGQAIAPAAAPSAVQEVIAAANRISTKPYVWGGGHGAWASSGYDCSGSVSFALHGGGFLGSPLDSTGLERWGAPGQGRWITVYANSGHTYAVIAGLRWDTSGNAPGISGPRWHRNLRPNTGFVVRHAPRY